MKLSEQQFLFAKNICKLINYVFEMNYSCTTGEFYRTPEQAKIYAEQGKGILNSLHCKRLAADLNLFSPTKQYLTDTNDYSEFGIFWESLHPLNRWGGRFKRADGNHFEMQEDLS